MRSIGNLSSRVALYRRDASAAGGRSGVTWTILGMYAAEVRKQSDKAFHQAAAEYTESLIYVTIRTPRTYRPAPMLRLDYLGDQYEVVETVPDMPIKGFTRLRCRLIKMGGDGVERP